MLEVAPPISEQLAPAPSQRRHWNAYPVGELLQEPFEAVSVWPCLAVPEIVGKALFTGATPVTVAVWLEVALAEP